MDMSSEAEQFHCLSMQIQQLCGDDQLEVDALTNPVRGQVSSHRSLTIALCKDPSTVIWTGKTRCGRVEIWVVDG